MKILVSLLLSFSAVYAHADVRIIVGRGVLTRDAIVADEELPTTAKTPALANLIKENKAIVVGIAQVSTPQGILSADPSQELVVAVQKVATGDKHSATWLIENSKITCANHSNCRTRFQIPMCEMLGLPLMGGATVPDKSCQVNCGGVKALALCQ